MIKIKSFAFNPFQVNTYVIYDETGECIIIDAACHAESEYGELFDFISGNSLIPKLLINTHGHVDHLTGISGIIKKYMIPFHMHADDKFLLDEADVYGRFFGIEVSKPPDPDRWIKDGDTLYCGGFKIIAFHVPGHSPGSLVFHVPEAEYLITGDVLFAGSIGRTDLPGGNFDQLISGIRSKLLVLPGSTRIFPGHGNESTIETEKTFNPFLNRSY